MKKKILAIAAALFGTFGMIAFAQMPDKSYKPQKFTDFAFEGILLDIDQQAKIDSINALAFKACPMQPADCQQQAQCAQTRCPNGQCMKVEGVTCDTAGCVTPGPHRRNHDVRHGHSNRRFDGAMRGMRPTREYIEAVKEVLTPEQYVTFLENIVTMPMPERGAMSSARGQRRDAPAVNAANGKDKGRGMNRSK